MDPRNKHHLKSIIFFLLAYYWKTSTLGENYGFILSTIYNLLVIWVIYMHEMNYKQPRVRGGGDVEVCIVGAGYSGICMAVRLKQMGIKFRIIEKSEKLGGTWWDNKYPGCACDIPSHLYSYSFAMNPNWTANYSERAEIQQYLEHVADKFGIIGKIEFGKKLVKTTWNKETSKWHLQLESGEEIFANAMVSCIGQIHVPKTPKFEGQENFKGEAFHSAEWKQGYDPTGRRVGVIGTGASAVQIVPTIASQVKHLYVFQRTPCWTARRDDFSFPRWMMTLFKVYPPLMYMLRLVYYWRNEFFLWATIRSGGILSQRLPRVIAKIIRRQIKDPELAEKLIPKYQVGCKRVTPSTTYLRTYNRENVTLVTDPIEQFTESGIKTKDGTTYDLDTIVFATGFDILKSYRALNAFTTIGVEKPDLSTVNGSVSNQANGHVGSETMTSLANTRSLNKEWDDTPNAYLGITVPDYPNAFHMLGPGTGLGTNSVIFMIECQANYIGECLRAMIEKQFKILNVKKSVNDEYQAWSQATIKNKAYNSPSCTSWYKNARGINWTLWPTHLTKYWRMTRNVNLNDYNCR